MPSELSRLTGARICQIDYRLAPQNPFPAALYDLLLTYLSLIDPPDGTFHDAVPPSKIVIAGESSGGNLCLGLLQFLLHLERSGVKKLPWKAGRVPLELPAGVGVLSCYSDQSDCMPSRSRTAGVDYSAQPIFYNMPNFPSDQIWPTHPPRYSAYCEGTALCHPLISPMNIKDWSGAPPMWLACGEESVLDSNKVIARRAAGQGVRVQWEEYASMPHIFPLLPGLEGTPQAQACLRSWASFLTRCISSIESSTHAHGTIVGIDGTVERNLTLQQLLPEVCDEQVEELMQSNMLKLEDSFRQRQRRISRL